MSDPTPDDLAGLRAAAAHVEASVRPPAFEALLRGAGQRRRRHRALAVGLLAVVVVGGTSTVAALDLGQPMASVPAGPTSPVVPADTPTFGETRGTPTTVIGPQPSTPTGPVAVRAAAAIASSTRLMDLQADPAGFLFESFAGCADLSTCESAWRLATRSGAEVARGVLTGTNTVHAYSGGFLVDDGTEAFSVSDRGHVRQVPRNQTGITPQIGDVPLPAGDKAGVLLLFRPASGIIAPAQITAPPQQLEWSTALSDAQGGLFVLSAPDPTKVDTTVLFRSDDHGASWRPEGPTLVGNPARLVVSGTNILVVTTGNCTVTCIVNASATTGGAAGTAGSGWVNLPETKGRALLDAVATGDGHLVLRDETMVSPVLRTLRVAGPGGWVSPTPATGLDLARVGTLDRAMAASTSSVYYAADPDTIYRSDDHGTTWRPIPAR